ncbi:MAG: site-specific integrase [Pseudomonadota bacterium]
MQTQLETLSDHIGPNTFVDGLTNAAFTRFVQKRRAEVSNSTVNRELQLARAVLMYCEDIHSQAIPRISWKRLKLKEPPRRERFLSADEFDRLMSIENQEIAAISAWAVFTGMRKDNIKTLTRAQVDIGAQRVRLVTKGNKRQLIKLSSAAMALLSARSDRQERIFDFTNFEKRWRAALAEAKVSDFRFHDLRHTFASWARMSGVDILDLKEAMNHSDISTTMRYAHVSPDYQESAHEKVAQSAFLSRNRSRSTPSQLQAIDSKRKK